MFSATENVLTEADVNDVKALFDEVLQEDAQEASYDEYNDEYDEYEGKIMWSWLMMGDDIGSGLLSFSIYFDFPSTNVMQLNIIQTGTSIGFDVITY